MEPVLLSTFYPCIPFLLIFAMSHFTVLVPEKGVQSVSERERDSCLSNKLIAKTNTDVVNKYVKVVTIQRMSSYTRMLGGFEKLKLFDRSLLKIFFMLYFISVYYRYINSTR